MLWCSKPKGRKVCQSAKFALVSNESVSLHDYHVVCLIHTSEYSANIRTNSTFEKFNKCHFTIIMSCVESTIRKPRRNRPSDNIRCRTYAILHCLNQIRIFYNFLVKTCFHHNICHHLVHEKFFKISFLALSGL